MTPSLERRLAAVMFTDMVGYTALMHEDEEAAIRARSRHRQALESELEARGGELLQYFGDGSLSIFASSAQAVRAAVAVQRALDGDPLLRIGLHVGDIAFDVQGAYGDAVNIAARLEARCPPGGVIISQTVRDDIRRQPDLGVIPRGSVRLKHIAEPVATYALGVPGLVTEDGRSRDPAAGPGQELPSIVLRRLEELALMVPEARGVGTVAGWVPLIGRRDEIDALREALDRAESGRASAHFVRGARGIGKTRLSKEVADEARDRGWTVLTGRAHPGQSRVPYAPLADAFRFLLGGLDRETVAGLTPGQGADLCELFPALGGATPAAERDRAGLGDSRLGLFWHFAALMSRLASVRPVLLVLEDLDYADQTSLELLEFVMRQCEKEPLVAILEYAGVDPASRGRIRNLEVSLVSGGHGRVHELRPLSLDQVAEFVEAALDMDPDLAREVGSTLHGWAGGNPLLLAGTLRGLVERGVIGRTDDGWKVESLGADSPPASVRDTVLVWAARLTPAASKIAESIAILGREVSYELLRHVSGTTHEELSAALDELVRHQLLQESESRWTLEYAFPNPIIRETLQAEIPLPRRRELHRQVAESLEAFYGAAADEHADELAYHFGRSHPGLTRDRTLHYLHAAGVGALRRYANQEARDYLQEALDLVEASPARAGREQRPGVDALLTDLARARRRCGDVQGSLALWRRLLAGAREAGEDLPVAALHRQLGLTHLAGGAFEEAIEEFAAAAHRAEAAGQTPPVVRARLSEAFCYQSTGLPHRAAEVVEESLGLAEAHGDPGLLGRVHRSRIQYNIWTGEIERAREAAVRALELSRSSGDRSVEFWSLWARAALEGLIGDTVQMGRLLDRCSEVAQEVGSPFFELARSELSVELAYARGEWDQGLATADAALTLARSAGERLVRPRILVWASLIHLGRGAFEEAEALTREAWEVSRADRAHDPSGVVDLHTVVPAHIGRAACALARGEWADAMRIADAGLRIADRSGYVVWAIHHLLPTLGEAAIHARELDRAAAAGARLRREADRLGHPLGLAWSEACDAILSWLQGDATVGARSLRRGAEALESIPLTYEGARLRRQLAGRLAEIGDLEGARAELRRVTEVFQRLGARPELAKATAQFEEIRPPDV